MRIAIRCVIFLLSLQTVFAQELPLNSQVFMNPYYYNPAYAGFEDRPALFLYRRQQWTGIEGAPVTSGLNFHTIFNNTVTFGVNIMSDERSILNTTRGLATIGYRLSGDEFHYLSFALSAGVGFHNIDLDEVDPSDPAIADALDQNTFLDGNAGVHYYNNGFNLGLSLPNIFRNNLVSSTSFSTGELNPLSEIILMSSYRWEINENKLALEPFVIYNYSQNRPGQFEVIGLIHFVDILWVGGSYRQDYGSTGLVGLNIKDNLKFGYAYEFFNTEQASFSNSTHELQLGLVFGKKKKKGKINMIQRRRNMLRSMGKLPNKKSEARRQIKKDPFSTSSTDEKQKTTANEYSEEQALKDLMGDMAVTKSVSEKKIRQTSKKDSVSIYNVTFDDVKDLNTKQETVKVERPKQETKMVEQPKQRKTVLKSKPKPAAVVKKTEEEDADQDFDELLAEFMEETNMEEDQEEDIPIVNGLSVGPRRVKKGEHLLDLDKGNYVIIGTFSVFRSAEKYVEELFLDGYYTKFGFVTETGKYHVYIYQSDDLQETTMRSSLLTAEGIIFKENWVLQVE